MFREACDSSETKEKVGPSQMVFLGEPILKRPTAEGGNILQVPKGDVSLALQMMRRHISEQEEVELLGNEYLDIAFTLFNNRVPFRLIVAHDDLVSVPVVLGLNQRYSIKGARFFKEIPTELTCFPRDIVFDLDGKILINPQANLMPVQGFVTTSLLGEGGHILKIGRKILLPSNLGFTKSRLKFEKDIRELLAGYEVGFLPWPFGVEIRNGGQVLEEFPGTHLDRVAAFIKGAEGRDYLLVDPNYLNDSRLPWGSYKGELIATARRMGITLVVIDKSDRDVPYGLNLVQFNDGSVFMSSGHKSLEALIKQIVGDDRVFTTNRPVIYFPILRRGGLNCMILFAPKRMFVPNLQGQP